MTIPDWYPAPIDPKYIMQSANNVPWPLDDYLELQCKPTIDETAWLVRILGGMGRMNDRTT